LAEQLADGPLESTECARIIDGAAAGVEALSQRALVARDLSPNRVFLDAEQGCMLMDLGIPPELLRRVPLEQDSDLAFRSPEELERQPVDLRSSVYSLGVLLFTALTGLPPGKYSARSADARLRPSDRRSELSPEIDAVIARALARDPAERYANPEALSRAAAAAIGADLAPKGVIPSRNGQRQQRLPNPAATSAQRNGARPTPPQKNGRPTPPPEQTHPQLGPTEIPPSRRRAVARSASRPAHRVAARFPAAAPRCVAVMATLLALAGTGARRGHAQLRRLAGIAGPMAIRAAIVAAAATRRGAEVVWTLFLRVCRLVLVAARRGALLAAVAARRARRALIRVRRSAPSVARDQGERVDRFARDGWKSGNRLMGGEPAPARHPPRRRAVPRSASRPAHRVAARFPAAARRCVAVMATLVALAGTAARRGHALLRRLAGVAGPMAIRAATVAAAATRRGAEVVWTLFLRVCRPVLAATRREAVVVAVAARRARRALIRVRRSAPSVARDPGGRIERFARDARATSTHRRLLLPAVGAIAASALSGIALGRAFEPEEGPSSVSRSGLTLQLPRGWEPADVDPDLPKVSSAIAAVPSGEAGAGFLAGKLSSLAAAERILDRVQREGDGRTQVRLGRLDAWQYAGLRPRPHVVGTGYLVPTTGGAVLGICLASANEAPVRLAECERAATTLVVRGERPRPLSSADRSNERVIRVMATLRASRAEGRRRLEKAKLARGQARAATSLQRSHQRAAVSLERISALENGTSLGNLSAAVRAAAAAYGRLAHAASVSNRPAYREASHAVVREDEALRRELAHVRDA
jgi:hypothetical protein